MITVLVYHYFFNCQPFFQIFLKSFDFPFVISYNEDTRVQRSSFACLPGKISCKHEMHDFGTRQNHEEVARQGGFRMIMNA
jgi:hypothetical protein